METLQYVKNAKGETTGLFIDISKMKKSSIDILEDLEDAISYELRKNSPKIDFDTFVKNAKKV